MCTRCCLPASSSLREVVATQPYGGAEELDDAPGVGHRSACQHAKLVNLIDECVVVVVCCCSAEVKQKSPACLFMSKNDAESQEWNSGKPKPEQINRLEQACCCNLLRSPEVLQNALLRLLNFSGLGVTETVCVQFKLPPVVLIEEVS